MNYTIFNVSELKKVQNNKTEFNDFSYWSGSDMTFFTLPVRIEGLAFGLCLNGWMEISIDIFFVHFCLEWHPLSEIRKMIVIP